MATRSSSVAHASGGGGHASSTTLRPHVLVVPFPVQGHLNPCISLALFLASSGVSLTLVQATHTHTYTHFPSLRLSPTPSSAPNGTHSHASAASPLRIEVIPGGLDDSQRFSMSAFVTSLDLMHQGVTQLLHKLMLEDNPPVCLLVDSFLSWGGAVAAEFGLSRIDLWTASASAFCLGCHVPDIVARGIIPATEEGAMDKVVDFVPGLSPFRVADMAQSLIAGEGLESHRFVHFSSVFQHAKSADCVLVNTMYELESSALEALRGEDHVHIYPVGPLFMISTAPSSPEGPLAEDDMCLSWLDQQQESSVLYIAFGSIASLEEEVLAELAHGLEASGERFLWVIRPDARKGNVPVEEILPQGFLASTCGRGLVIPWAPQLPVLGHPSIGAFLTHCGWNSVLESLSNGVPMLGFPQMAEQNTNFKFMMHDWKVGLPLIPHKQEQGQCGRKLERADVQSAIMKILRGDEGMQARVRAREWKEVARKTSQGSSKDNLQKLVHDLKHGGLLKRPA